MHLSDKVPTKRPRIEIIPLIDCMFLLLVFFVYSMMTLSRPHGIPVNLPAALTAPAIEEESFSITITEDDEVYLDKELVTLDSLTSRLAAACAENPSLRVYINGDKRARHGAVVKVLDVLRQLSIRHVAIQTAPLEPEG